MKILHSVGTLISAALLLSATAHSTDITGYCPDPSDPFFTELTGAWVIDVEATKLLNPSFEIPKGMEELVTEFKVEVGPATSEAAHHLLQQLATQNFCAGMVGELTFSNKVLRINDSLYFGVVKHGDEYILAMQTDEATSTENTPISFLNEADPALDRWTIGTLDDASVMKRLLVPTSR